MLATREWEDLLVRIECDCQEWYPGEDLTCAPSEYSAGDDDSDEGEGEAGVRETAADAA